ncbi:MAG: Lipid-A-disaccharide synthase [Bacteroidota bacterium]|jgi:lipid-A-disaccharide synthase
MKYFILAGEKSGDLHGSNLVKELKKLDSQAEFQAWGGDAMAKEGAKINIHYKDLAIMGLLGVIQNLKRLQKNFDIFKNQINTFKPDVVIFIDYGGFNLRAARIAKTYGFTTHFYIAPKVWAWNKMRISKIKKWIDYLYVIFPFEKKLFEEHKINTFYVGNPLKDSVDNFISNPNFIKENNLPKDYIALLPGSRKQEINYNLPILNQVQKANPNYQFIIAGVPEFRDLYKTDIPVIINDTYNILTNSRLAIVTSGTATLETALLKIPQIVIYKTDWIFYSLAKVLVNIKHISLVNIILNKLAIPELIQGNFNLEQINSKIEELYPDTESRINQLKNYQELEKLVGENGASKKVAELIIQSLNHSSNF